jgi:hypothetical protein
MQKPYFDHPTKLIFELQTIVVIGIANFQGHASVCITASTGKDNSGDTKDGLPIIQVTEGSNTLMTLLIMCYPMQETTVYDYQNYPQ